MLETVTEKGRIMNSKDKKPGASGELKNITAPGKDQASVQSPTVRLTEADAGLEMRAELSRALGYYRLGRYQEAEAELQKLVCDLERLMKRTSKRTSSATPSLAQLSLLHASAHGALGRVRQQLGKSAEAESDFRRAIATFSQWLEEEHTGPEYGEYGVALYLAGDKEKAVKVLEKSVGMGNICPEAYTYLATCRLEQKRYVEAEALLRKASAIIPDDLVTLEALARTLEALQRPDEAVGSYQEAAYVLASSSRFDDALSLLDRALAINPGEAKPGEAELITRKAQYQHLKGDPEQALQTLDQASAPLAQHASAWTVRGKVLYTLGRSQEAVQSLQRAVKLDPTLHWAYYDLGLALDAVGRYEDALQAIEQTLESAPESPSALGVKGRILRSLGRNKEAVELLQYVVKIDPAMDWAYADLGAALRDMEQYDAALGALRQALALNPRNVIALATKGDALVAKGDALEGDAQQALSYYNEAIQALDQALALEPSYTFALAVKGKALKNLGQYNEALRMMDSVLSLAPKHAWTLRVRGQILKALDRREEAVQSLRQAIESDPTLSWAYIDLANVLIELNETGQAMEALDQALERTPDKVLFLRIKGMWLNELGRHDQALEPLNQALSFEPEDASLWLNKAKALYALNYPAEGLEAIERALQLTPNDLPALETKCQILLDQGSYDDALQVLDRALSLKPSDIAFLRSKGYTLLRLRREDEALETFKQILEKDNRDSWALTAAASVSKTREEYDQAWGYLEKALSLLPDQAPERAWALGIKGNILCDFGAFHLAVEALDQATQLDPSDADGFFSKGWALENLGRDNVQAAWQADEEGLKKQPDSVWGLKGLANTLRLMGRREEANARYTAVLRQLQEQGELDDDLLSLKGWCHYCLGQYDEAAQSFIETLSLNPGLISTQFDLALVLMRSQSYDLALKGYKQGLEMTANKHSLRRRGLLYIARDDLREAVKTPPSLRDIEEAGKALELLNKAYDETYSGAMAHSSLFPQELLQATVLRSDPSDESISAELKAIAVYLEGRPNGRSRFTARIGAVIKESGREIGPEELIRMADKGQWSTWAVECLPSLYITLATLPDGRQRALAWHYILECVPESYPKYNAEATLCNELIIEACLPREASGFVKLIAPVFEQKRRENPHSSSRAMIGVVADVMAYLEREVSDQGDTVAAEAFKKTRTNLLAKAGHRASPHPGH